MNSFCPCAKKKEKKKNKEETSQSRVSSGEDFWMNEFQESRQNRIKKGERIPKRRKERRRAKDGGRWRVKVFCDRRWGKLITFKAYIYFYSSAGDLDLSRHVRSLVAAVRGLNDDEKKKKKKHKIKRG